MSDPVHEAICKSPKGYTKAFICQNCGHVHEARNRMTKEEANELIHSLLASHYIAPLTHQAIRDKIITALTGKEEA